MQPENEIETFLAQYPEPVFLQAMKLRALLLENLPDITEQIDIPAKMIGYCYSQKYIDLICVIIPSKKGLKLGFNRGSTLPDPHKMLEGTGKISRYVQIKNEEQIGSKELLDLLGAAMGIYRELKEGDGINF